MLVMLFFAEFINKVPKYLRRTIHQRTFEPSPPKPGKELPKAAESTPVPRKRSSALLVIDSVTATPSRVPIELKPTPASKIAHHIISTHMHDRDHTAAAPTPRVKI
ncbi:unnamed protein product [Zymoseptoria tritici ST99CH_3D7]|uniref:Uncharacterized protein n=1 Tax=Zymoseptoria tritici (strain ST99CH_3D7) TaxID=1276538 RepID=A0A1X7RGV2_ZYMT9|nr:unnamed protein product [Zymoseptoria tritici ST99CH_3D7]